MFQVCWGDTGQDVYKFVHSAPFHKCTICMHNMDMAKHQYCTNLYTCENNIDCVLRVFKFKWWLVDQFHAIIPSTFNVQNL